MASLNASLKFVLLDFAKSFKKPHYRGFTNGLVTRTSDSFSSAVVPNWMIEYLSKWFDSARLLMRTSMPAITSS